MGGVSKAYPQRIDVVWPVAWRESAFRIAAFRLRVLLAAPGIAVAGGVSRLELVSKMAVKAWASSLRG
jgi:hypothetical protein